VLAPVLDEGDVGVRAGGDLHLALPYPTSAAPAARSPSYPPAVTANASRPRDRQAATTSPVRPGASAITAPPPPAPVSLAADAPARAAASHSASMPRVLRPSPARICWARVM